MPAGSLTASDLTPENFAAGRRAAREAGVDLEWVEGDVQALPFPDAEFDVVTSCFGAMFAPDHQATARELLRVCRPGGVVGMMNFTPDGAGGDFFTLLSRYAPPSPPGALPPLLWGTEAHVRHLFGDAVQSLSMTREQYVERAASAREYFELFKNTFGPMVAISAYLGDRAGELDRAFLQYIARWTRGGSDGSVSIPYDYQLVIARKR
jgi:2-polyprenyl-6-hydroxyphenyl methylase/3-demethylubiquinone-9 3-methyltransferase